jgi:hypothetical protein
LRAGTRFAANADNLQQNLALVAAAAPTRVDRGGLTEPPHLSTLRSPPVPLFLLLFAAKISAFTSPGPGQPHRLI